MESGERTLENPFSDFLKEGRSEPSEGAIPASTEGRIIAAALELFAERSYEATTTQAIAKRAGVTERTLFKHFKNKEGLFAKTVFPALLKLISPITIDELLKIVDERRGDFRATIRGIVEERVTFALKHPAIVKLIAQEVLLRPAFREAALKFASAHMGPSLQRFFDEARERGQMRDVPTAFALRSLVSCVAGFLISRLILLPDVPWDEAQEVALISDFILDGLAVAGQDA